MVVAVCFITSTASVDPQTLPRPGEGGAMRVAGELGEVAVGKAAASMRMYMPQRRPAGRVGAA